MLFTVTDARVCAHGPCIFILFTSRSLPRYLKLLCGISDDWLVTAPRSIKSATALGITSSSLLTYALWPVFGMVTLPLLFLLLLGFIEVWHFIPTP